MSTENNNYSERMSCSKETKDLIMNECVKEFIFHHPEFEGSNITQGFMLRKLAEFYIKY